MSFIKTIKEKTNRLLADEKKRELIAYLIVGVLTTLVSWAAKFLWNFVFYGNTAYPTAGQHAVLSTVAWVAGVTFAFFTNRKIVFRSEGKVWVEALKFVASRLSTYFLDLGIMELLGTLMGINVYAATVISAVAVTIVNYILSKLFVFNKK